MVIHKALIKTDFKCYSIEHHSVQLSKPSDATHSARPMGQPGRSRRLPQPGQLMIGDDLLGYHNNIKT